MQRTKGSAAVKLQFPHVDHPIAKQTASQQYVRFHDKSYMDHK